MKRWIPFALVVAAFAGGRLTAAEDAPKESPKDASTKTVSVKRYRIVWAESGGDLARGGGTWVDEFWFPEAKVAAGIVHEWKPSDSVPAGTDPKEWRRPRIYARPADAPRTGLTGLHEAKPSETTDATFPADLAKQVVQFAALQERWESEGLRVGAEVARRLDLKPLGE